MSGAQTSTFPTMNELLAPMAAYDVHQNQLLNQQSTQRQLSSDEIEQISRAANWVVSADPENKDPAGQAQRYGAAVRILNANGYAKNAPSEYPGFDAMQGYARLGTPSVDQYKLDQARQGGAATLSALGIGGGGGGGSGVASPGGGGSIAPSQLAIPGRGAGGPGATAQLPPQYLDYFRQASAETGIPMDLLIAQARQESTFDPNAKGAAGEIGMFQIKPSTAQSPGFGITGVDPASLTGNTPEAVRNNILFGARYLRARMGQGNPNDPAAQAAALAAYNGGGDPNYAANVNRYRPGLSPSDPNAAVTTYAAAPPAAAPGGGTTPPPYRVAQAGPLTTPPPAATTAPQAASPAPVTTIEPETGLPMLSAPPNSMMPGQPNGPAVVAPAAAPPPPPAAVQPPPATNLPPIKPPPQTSQAGFTPTDEAVLRSMAAGGYTREQILTEADRRKTANDTAQRQYAQDVATRQEKQTADARAAATQQREEAARAEAAEKAQRDREAAADPIQGKDDKANADRLLLKYADKILDGSATTEERRLYAQAAQYYLKPQMQWISDSNDPTKSIMVPVPGQLPQGFPHPSYKPGEQPAAQPPAATKSDFKPLPENDRKQLLETATRLDQLNEQRSGFKPEYGGFVSAAVGDFANAAARNNPIASKADTARAEWWQNYQRMKLAVRQGISGQSLTASELAEFDKADINPGMTPETIQANLAHQDQILRTAHERRVASLAADRYNPDAIKAASGLDPGSVKPRPVESGPTQKPAEGGAPPGFRIIVP
jgi:Transglycosylase SLT domain